MLNWILSERLTALAAPLWQNIPIGNLTGYNVSLRVRLSCFLPASLCFGALCHVTAANISYLGAFTFICLCVLQVQAGNLTPVTALVQNLLMSALFEPFEALCSAANAEMAEVWTLIGSLASLLRCRHTLA